MKTLLTFCLMLTCATLHAQSVIVKGTGAGAVHRFGTGAGSVRGVVTAATYTNYSDGRFTIWNTNQEVVLDNDSGKSWTRNANLDGLKDWPVAVTYCEDLVTNGYSDWRMASITEFSRSETVGSTNGFAFALFGTNAALPPGHPFTNIVTGGMTYWANTTDPADTNKAYDVSLNNGYVATRWKEGEGDPRQFLPCRGP